jgi:hypothetical protein
MNGSTARPTATIRIERDLCYGEGAVGFGTPQPGTRALLMDVYLPAAMRRRGAAGAGAGARRRLSPRAKDHDEFEQDGSHNTPVHEYCERFAARGYACFSVGYRLTQERPAPLARPIKRNRQAVERDRIDFVRGLLGLPPATHDELLHGAEAALPTSPTPSPSSARMPALGHRCRSHGDRRLFRRRLCVGLCGLCDGARRGRRDRPVVGHGRGGRRVLRARRPRACRRCCCSSASTTCRRSRRAWARWRPAAARAGLGMRHYLVPGKPHFYDRESAVVLKQSTLPGGEGCATVEAAIEQFLSDVLVPPAVTSTIWTPSPRPGTATTSTR